MADAKLARMVSGLDDEDQMEFENEGEDVFSKRGRIYAKRNTIELKDSPPKQKTTD